MEYSNKLDDYILKEVIGKGTFGIVYRGIHKANNKEVALKIIELKKLKQTKNGISRIKTEIDVQSKLNHDGIIKLFQSFIHFDKNDKSQKYVLILELCFGGTLSNYLKKQKCGKLSECQTYNIFYQLVEIVRYLHQNEIIHRDLKLQNILIYSHKKTKENIIVKLCDFGLATSISTSPDRYTWCGTPNFCAPEIAKHEKHGYLVDVWSLGIILLTLLTGSPPFHSDNAKNTLNKIIKHQKINLPHYLSKGVQILIKKLLNKSAKQRINTFDILNESWIVRKGKSINIINILHLKPIKKYLKALNVKIEINNNPSKNAKIYWNENKYYLQIFGNNKNINIMATQKKEYDIYSLPIQYYKVYDILSSFISIISSQTPVIALFINNNNNNKYRLNTIILLQNNDIDFTFYDSSLLLHYQFKTNSFQAKNSNNNNNPTKVVRFCKDLIDIIHNIYTSHKTSYPIEMKFDLKSKIATHHFEENKWKYFLPQTNMACVRIKNGKINQIFQFEDNDKISIIIQGKETPYLIDKANENYDDSKTNNNTAKITPTKGSNYNKYWQCITTVLQL